MYRHSVISLLLFTSIASATIDVQYVEDLQPTQNMSLVQDLKTILNSYRYTEAYEAGKFDCLESCSITFNVLQDAGYHPRIIMRTVNVDCRAF